MKSLQIRLAALPAGVLGHLNRGVERESLRVDDTGTLSLRAHPASLGSALTHPNITTDFSEAQIEMVTDVHPSIEACLGQLRQIHQLVYRGIGDELLWSTSMPCRLPADDEIPIGQYGGSNIGRLKTVYRYGLSHRYGRRMQTISGVHYNFSLPEQAWPALQAADGASGDLLDYQNQAYFGLIRNFRRHSWLLLYLFGASPAVCGSFVAGRTHRLQPLGDGSMYLPHGTSMRMGPLGYQSDAQAALAVSYNDLAGYARTLTRGLTQPYPPYVDIGIREAEGYRQLNTTLLQIENEFYGTIRPKQRVRPGERPLRALSERGVEYVEVRCLDIDPFTPLGLAAETARFVDTFLLHCLLTEAPNDSPESIRVDGANQLATAERGRAPDLHLQRPDGRRQSLRDWGHEILTQCAPIAAAIDGAQSGSLYRDALATARQRLDDPGLTPSARVLATMHNDWQDSYQSFALDRSIRHRREMLALPLAPAVVAAHEEAVARSLREQQALEAADQTDFETYRRNYMTQDLGCAADSAA
ncbi:MAG: glutamate--cysteine ligase [Burkholderiaceae bacterium]